MFVVHSLNYCTPFLFWHLNLQLAFPSRQVSLSVDDEIDSIIPSEFGILVIPEDVSSLTINSQYADQPIFWSLGKFVLGDQVSWLFLQHVTKSSVGAQALFSASIRSIKLPY